MDSLFRQFTLWLSRKSSLFTDPTPLFVLAVILITGYVFTKISKKFKIPIVTGQIIGGIFLGKYLLNIFPTEAYESFVPISNFALGFFGLLIGSHLDFHKLHNAGKRIFLIFIFDALATPAIVFFSLYLLAGVDIIPSFLISAISITTAPSTTLHIIREKRAKGMFTKTILAVVALNNVMTILIFYAFYYYLFYNGATFHIDFINTIAKPALLLLEAILIGGIVGFSLIYITEKRKMKISFFILIILAVIFVSGISETFHLSGILSCLILGMILTNYSKHRQMLFGAFKEIEVEIFTIFFVLAGTHLDFSMMAIAKIAGITLIVSRLIGKTLMPTIGAYFAGSTKTIKKWIGIALYPFAGVAIGLVLIVENNNFFDEYSAHITAVVLTAVVINELLGPIFTGLAIKKSGEEHKNRIRLMDFLQEEFIKVDCEAKDKWEALDTLAAFMHKTHKMDDISLVDLKKSIVERENDISTGIGGNLAIPHAIIEGGPKIQGVIGVSRKGIEFDSLDDKPVHIIILIATPKQNYDLHLKVLANIAKIFGHHPHIKDQIIKSKSPEEVFEILQTEEIESLNPYFED